MNRTMVGSALVALVAAGCASSGVRATDPWLTARKSTDCSQPSCLFAVVQDSSGTQLPHADVELSGTSIHANTDSRGRLALQNIPLGSRRIRLFADGAPIESAPL